MSRKTRKLMWSVPLIAAVAVIGALALLVSLSPNLAQAHDVPGVPTDLSAMPAQDDPSTPEVEGRTQIVLTWKAPTGTDMGITGYRIDRSKDGHVWKELVANSGTPDVLTYTDTVKGSAAGTEYFYRVLAVNTSGVGPMSVIDDGTTLPLEAPDAPENVKAEANGATEIVLRWMPPEDDGGSAITKYRIIWDPPGAVGFPGAAGITAGTQTVEGDVCEFSANGGYLEYRHKKLMANQEYRFQVYAINSIGVSSGSAIRNATTDDKEQPDAPTDVLAVQVDATTVQLYWNWPESNGGAPITGFRVEVTERSGQWPARDANAPDTSSAGSTSPNLATADDPSTTDVNEEVFNGAFTLPEDQILADNAHEATHTHGYDTVAATATGVDTTLYYRVFTMTGTDEDGRSRSAGSTSVKLVGADGGTIADLLPPVIDDVAAAAPLATVDKHGNYSKLTLNWTSPDDNPTSYRIDYSSDGEEWKRLEEDTRLAKPGEYTDAGLDPETTRHYRVFGKRGGKFRVADKSDAAETGSAIAPGNVQAITATANGADMIQLRWEQPMYDGGADITHYQVQKSANGNDGWAIAKWLEVERNPDSCELEPIGMWTDKSLMAGETAYYRVYAINSASPQNGGSDPSATVLAVTAADEADPETDHATTAAAMKPDAPIGLSAELAKDSKLKGVGDEGVLLIWNAPKDPAGSPITGYRIERKVMGKDDDKWMELEASSTAEESHYTDREELGSDMRYYRVAALNRLANDTEGVSSWSNVSEIPLGMHSPGAPSGLTAMKDATDNTTQINLSWTAPTSGAPLPATSSSGPTGTTCS